MIATAQTGSGKTAAFLLPILDRLHQHPARGVRALVLAPTRELAFQIGREFQLFCNDARIRAAVIVGGESMNRQLGELRRGVQLIVACPGRLIDHLDQRSVKLDMIDVVVIDEADRMLDMGFMPQVRRILKATRSPRQTLMFSATMDPQVQHVAREFLTNPVEVRADDISTPRPEIKQSVCPVTQEKKPQLLLHLLGRDEVISAIVFTRTKTRADRVAKLLTRNRVNAVAIHGGRSQSQRTSAMAGFRKGQYRVLVATDVAARGIDIPDVSHVINFDLPEEPDSYVHRIGRTGRMGKLGEAVSFVRPEDRMALRGIERTLRISIKQATIQGFEQSDMASGSSESSSDRPAKLNTTSSVIQQRRHRPRHAKFPSARAKVS
ncbi:MAG TPA: DEAD/DEAH box helicase [Candidatus Binataceae bacterium]|nr:DEAD/DEAH box helicase [Candidatus Binataceae bacterium]